MSNKIFVSIAAFEDKALIKTMNNILLNADEPENIVFGLALNYKVYPDFSEFSNDIRIVYDKQFNFPGIVKMRDEIRKLIKDEVYFLGLDAHTICQKSWDTKLIKDIEELTLDNKKIIISSQINFAWSKFTPVTSWKMEGFWNTGWGLGGLSLDHDPDLLSKTVKMVNSKYFLNHYISCNFIFMKTKDIPEARFPGYHGFPWEEVEQSITSYCNGFDVVAPLIENSYIRRDIDERYIPPFDPDFWTEVVPNESNNWQTHKRKWILDSKDMQDEVEKLVLSGKNKYYSLEGSVRSVSDFYRAVGLFDKYNRILQDAKFSNFKSEDDRLERMYAPYEVDKLRNDNV